MNFFNVLTLFGGLAMFLYGMRLMGNGLKESSSGTLKVVMEKVTNSPFKAFLLGVAVTAIIQSSTATIVITSGLVGAGIIKLRQSMGIVIGANVGTTVTGQIIRLLDLDSSAVGWLQLFKPSTLAPVALIAGIILIMGFHFKNSRAAGNIAIGFGILFTGLLNMTGAVDTLSETGLFDRLFSSLGSNPFLGYLIGASVAFILQSSSATIGILQAFSAAGQLMFHSIYAVIVGIYLGDCVTTAIVCSIGAKAEARRVGIVNILFNLSETVLVLAAVFLLRKLGVLDALWDRVVGPGSIANTNTIFNLGCALLLFPMLPVYERLSRRIVRDEPTAENKYKEQINALSPAFFTAPALALNSCYDMLLTMLGASRGNLNRGLSLLRSYDEALMAQVQEEEDNIDLLTARTSNYLVSLSMHLSAEKHIAILNQYYKLVDGFERIGDHAMNIAEDAGALYEKNLSFSEHALEELDILEKLINQILDYTELAVRKRDEEAARHIEPLEEVMDDLIEAMKENHLTRMRKNECNIYAGAIYMNLLGDMERISDICSNVALSVLARVDPALVEEDHGYISSLHEGKDEFYNREYAAAREEFFGLLRSENAASAKLLTAEGPVGDVPEKDPPTPAAPDMGGMY